MDFPEISQMKDKKFWWMDVIFYFVLSLLLATIISYIIFLLKDNAQRQDIAILTKELAASGTSQQKAYESTVVNYQKKINDFNNLFTNHEFASNVFAFMQAQTLPNIWFEQFNLDEKNNTVQLSGEADNMDAFSKQITVFEENKYVKNLGNLSSSIELSGKITFNLTLTLDQGIFSYISGVDLNSSAQQSQPVASVIPSPTLTPAPTTAPKLITSFNILLNPAIMGTIDETNYVVMLSVPYGTNVKNLTPIIAVSPGATVSPASNVAEDFTNPVTYTVSGQDGSTQNYKVTVNVLPIQQ